MPTILDKCVERLISNGKDKSSAFAICTNSLKKSGKLESFNVEEGSEEFEEIMKTIKFEDSETKNLHFACKLSEDQIQLSNDEKSVKIQILKEIKIMHPWYGRLNFDKPFFSKMEENFNKNIPQQKISFDFKHQPDWGAAAWVNKIFQEPGGLFAEVELTKRGREAIKNKEFIYFSSEFSQDYVEITFKETLDKDNNKIEQEIKNSFGPTLMGGGLTNRPFLKGMNPIALSEDGHLLDFEDLEDNSDMKKTLTELKEAHDALKVELDELKKKTDETSQKEISEKAIQLSEISSEIASLLENINLEEKESEIKTLKEELDAKNAKLEEESTKITKLSDDVKSLADSVTALMTSNEKLQEEKHLLSVDKTIAKFEKMGIFPGTCTVIRKYLSVPESKNFSVQLSEDGTVSTKNLSDVIQDIISTIPEEYRLSTDEISESVTTPTGNAKELSLEDVDKYAKENSMTFEDAIIDLSKQGKIIDN